MTSGVYHYIKQLWRKPEDLTRGRMIGWRSSDAVEKVERPLRLDRARALGYKAKKGVIILRVRIARGGRTRPKPKKGRKTRKQSPRKTLKMSYQWVAEIRAARKYPGLEVLNSYWVGRDGKHYYFEVIMVDPNRPEIKSDRTLSWITSEKNRKRAERGLTSAAKKSRGLVSKSGKSPKLKVRPSLRAWTRSGK
jgi:large subunit ribosomal protein L15e